MIHVVHAAYANKAQDLGIVVGGGPIPHGHNFSESHISRADGTLRHLILISMSAKNTLHYRVDTEENGRRSQGKTMGLDGQKNEIEAIYEEIARRVMFPNA